MKPKLLKILNNVQESFGLRFDSAPFFFNEWHFHPEIELVYIENESGTEFIGNTIQSFNPGDMIMVGSGLPHLWRCDDKYFKPNSTLKAESLVIHFLPALLGDAFLNLPENKSLLQLFEKSKFGLKITNKTKDIILQKMQVLLENKLNNRMLLLLDILYTLASSKEVNTVLSKDFESSFKQNETERMNNIIQFVSKNFTKKINLTIVASIAHMSPESFCRYFKTRTKKTFSDFLLEIRINHACKLLIETDKPIHQICFASGFNNFSNFNRYFKKKMGTTPLKYRNLS